MTLGALGGEAFRIRVLYVEERATARDAVTILECPGTVPHRPSGDVTDEPVDRWADSRTGAAGGSVEGG